VSSAKLAVRVRDVSGEPGVPAAARVRAWVRHALGDGIQGELGVRIVTLEEMADLNWRYRRKRGPTNVLAFPSEIAPLAGEEPTPIGDLVIAAAVVEREAGEQGKSREAHWAHIVIHGALHLVGYDHATERDARVMEDRERVLLAALGFPDPYLVRV
jgi:probable rRNA maturation factor